ncbi:MAG: saccharopine dehydrogenase [Rhodospirillaceae bacterium]|jgi:saccharopine dehydrogenase-like NADP-dependent oxidoreductase|nr:saccharopine dehydrogenase [Rhodospirillaceae bacterium]MBT5245251.1 saccharopine dehydrogenase [Rhodospirillaceae bacterium]MBT5563081.1 saccharopine dehydrogenase [Rhodospirillaceae bacterium]MBT6241397.1 saccharopine dehydrogenase [Rhodospirillaceae bacterium]MBT7138099.1 saccharopine dehydrogenase [Rhodospirillaceae bacterium]
MDSKPCIHWLGAGLSSGPGIAALARRRGNVVLWNRTVEKAQALVKTIGSSEGLSVEALDFDRLAEIVQPGDVVISMLPGAFHTQVAQLSLQADAHMVTTSYLSPEMQALDVEAKAKGLVVLNEVGVDPGIDHLFAQILVDEARRAGMLGDGHSVSFESHCGGVPAVANDFRYKFSWAPLGVVTALGNQSRSIRNGQEFTVEKAWTSVEEINVLGETFEVYPNRDSIGYIEEYGLADVADLQLFVRGTLRLPGWKAAWADIFKTVETGSSDDLKALSEQLWSEYAYGPDEKDRVILYVSLTSQTADGESWKASLSLDETGSGWQTAMARTVSLTAQVAIGAVLDGRLQPGVQAATRDPAEAKRWLGLLSEDGISFHAENVTL